MIERLLKVTDAQEESVFLFGARQTGKTTLLLHLFPDNRFYDLLETDTYERLLPSRRCRSHILLPAVPVLQAAISKRSFSFSFYLFICNVIQVSHAPLFSFINVPPPQILHRGM